MTSDDTSVARYQFTDQVDILAALDTLEIEHLEVSDERTIVIYVGGILDLEISDGQLNAARTLEVDVFAPPSGPDDADPTVLIDRIGSFTQTDWHPSHTDV